MVCCSSNLRQQCCKMYCCCISRLTIFSATHTKFVATHLLCKCRIGFWSFFGLFCSSVPLPAGNKTKSAQSSLALQQLRLCTSTAGGVAPIPGQETVSSCMPHGMARKQNNKVSSLPELTFYSMFLFCFNFIYLLIFGFAGSSGILALLDPRFQRTGSVVVALGLSHSTACEIYHGSGTEPVPPALAGGFFTTEPPEKQGFSSSHVWHPTDYSLAYQAPSQARIKYGFILGMTCLF